MLRRRGLRVVALYESGESFTGNPNLLGAKHATTLNLSLPSFKKSLFRHHGTTFETFLCRYSEMRFDNCQSELE